MSTQLKALTLAKSKLEYELLVSPLPEGGLAARRAAEPYANPSIAYVIEHPEGRILWDSGLSSRAREEWPEEWQGVVDLSGVRFDLLLEERLRTLGLGPEDFDYVLLSHLHSDHVGGLRLFEHAPARIVCHAQELAHVSGFTEDQDFYVLSDFDFLFDREPQTVADEVELLRDVWLHPLPGHTPGTMGLSVRLEHSGWMLLASDALYTCDSYGPPAVGSPVVWDADLWRASVDRLRRIATEKEALLVPGHDETGLRHSHGHATLCEVPRHPEHTFE